MRQTQLLAALAVALALVVVVPAVGLAATDSAVADTHQNETDENATAPGERLSGVVGVQGAELEGDIDQRAFGVRVAQAQTQDAQADVVDDQLGDVDQRLSDLRERKAELDAQREAGEISEGKYRAEVAELATEVRTAEHLTNRSEETAGQLPADLLAEHGVDADRIQQLRTSASELGGPEVAEIARGIAGQGAGQTPATDRPVDVPDRPERPGDGQQTAGGDAPVNETGDVPANETASGDEQTADSDTQRESGNDDGTAAQ